MKIIAVVVVVSSKPERSVFQLSFRLIAAMKSAPAAPTAAASEGVKYPRYMPPSTTRNSKMTCQTSTNTRSRAIQGVLSMAIPNSGRRAVVNTTASMYKPMPSTPGSTPAANSCPMDCSVNKP